MQPRDLICFQFLAPIYRQRYKHYIGILLAFAFFLLSPALLSDTHETEYPKQKLAVMFPKAKRFVQRSVILSPAKITAIEEKLGTKLRTTDLKPIFYIPINNEKKPMGLVLFSDSKGPQGVIEGAVGLDMKGKVVKIAVYRHKESAAIAEEAFLKQFVGMGIDNLFKVKKDVTAIEGHEDASNAVALIPKKALVMSYALFRKNKPSLEEEKTPEPDTPTEQIPEVEDLKALMALMIDDYFVIMDYFEEKESKTEAIQAAKRLAKYAKSISDFEPPKNADQTEEYVYLQNKFSETLLEFAKLLETEGASDETQKQWTAIVELINQAHLRFSEEEIDLDTY